LTARLRLAALLAAGLLACHSVGDESSRIVLVDDAGDSLRLAQPARRIVSLNPVITELVFALGAGERLVGRTSECDYPPAAARVASVGGWLPPNVEAVAARSPDLVILYQGPTVATAAQGLRALGIPVLALRTDHLADLPRLARLLGPALAASRRADSLVSAFEATLDTLRRAAAPVSAPSVVLVAWDQPLVVLGAGSYVSELVELAGGRNVYRDLPLSSVPTSLESIISRAPAVVVTVGRINSDFARRPEWQVLPSVREHRILSITESALTRPSPRSLAAIPLLRRQLEAVRMLHPRAQEIPR
jgi:iron complex transport system substrate-binding protein